MPLLLARIISKLRRGGGDQVAFLPDSSERRFGDLMSHSEEISRDLTRMVEFKSYTEVLAQFMAVQKISQEIIILCT